MPRFARSASERCRSRCVQRDEPRTAPRPASPGCRTPTCGSVAPPRCSSRCALLGEPVQRRVGDLPAAPGDRRGGPGDGRGRPADGRLPQLRGHVHPKPAHRRPFGHRRRRAAGAWLGGGQRRRHPDSFTVSKVTGEITRRTVAAKTPWHQPDPKGSGVLETEVPGQLRDVPLGQRRGDRRTGRGRPQGRGALRLARRTSSGRLAFGGRRRERVPAAEPAGDGLGGGTPSGLPPHPPRGRSTMWFNLLGGKRLGELSGMELDSGDDVRDVLRVLDSSGLDELHLELAGSRSPCAARAPPGWTAEQRGPAGAPVLEPTSAPGRRRGPRRRSRAWGRDWSPSARRCSAPSTGHRSRARLRSSRSVTGSRGGAMVGIVEAMKMMTPVTAGRAAASSSSRRQREFVERPTVWLRWSRMSASCAVLIANRGEIAVRVVRACRAGHRVGARGSDADLKRWPRGWPIGSSAWGRAGRRELPDPRRLLARGGHGGRGRRPPGLRLPSPSAALRRGLRAAG